MNDINNLVDEIKETPLPLAVNQISTFNIRSQELQQRLEVFKKTISTPDELMMFSVLKELSKLTDKISCETLLEIPGAPTAPRVDVDWISSKFFNLYNMLLVEKHPNAKGQLDYINDRIMSSRINDTLSMEEQAAFRKFDQDMMHHKIKISSAEPTEIPQILADNARLINDFYAQFIMRAQDLPAEAAPAAAAECMTPPLRHSLSLGSLNAMEAHNSQTRDKYHRRKKD